MYVGLVYICVYMHVHVYVGLVYICVYMHVHVYVQARQQHWPSPFIISKLFKTWSLNDLKLTILVRLAGQQSLRALCLCALFPGLEY